jgi:hypothetical protein
VVHKIRLDGVIYAGKIQDTTGRNYNGKNTKKLFPTPDRPWFSGYERH